MFRQVLFVVAIGLPLTAFGSAYTLKQALQEAFENSPVLQTAEAKYDEGRWRNNEAIAAFVPTITLSGSHFVNKRYQFLNIPFNGNMMEIPQIFPTSSATLGARWLVFDGFSNIQLKKGASEQESAAKDHLEWTRFSLTRQVKLAYARVIAAKRLAEVAEQNVTTLENHLSQVKSLKKGGLATNYDILKIESQLSEASAELLQARDNIQLSEEKLGTALGIDEPAQVSESTLPDPQEGKIKNLIYPREKSKRLDLSELTHTALAADYLDSATGRYWVPKLSVGANYIKYNNLSDRLADWDRYRSAWDVGVFLTWDILNPRLFAKTKQEHYKNVQVEKSLRQATLQAPVDFAFWKKRYLYNATLFRAKKMDLQRANETVRLAQAGFKAGVRTTIEVLDAELELFRARAGIIKAQVDCIEAFHQLELSLGESL